MRGHALGSERRNGPHGHGDMQIEAVLYPEVVSKANPTLFLQLKGGLFK